MEDLLYLRTSLFVQPEAKVDAVHRQWSVETVILDRLLAVLGQLDQRLDLVRRSSVGDGANIAAWIHNEFNHETYILYSATE